MTTAEALAAFPGLVREGDEEGSGSAGTSLVLAEISTGTRAVFHTEADRVAEVVLEIEHCKNAEETLVAAWGPAQRGMFKHSQPERWFWASRETGWVASLDVDGDRGRCAITFTSAAYFGAPAALPGVLASLRFGMTQRELDRLPGGLRLDGEPVELTGVSGSTLRLRAGADGRLNEYELSLPEPALEAVRIAWGPGHRIDLSSAAIWFDETRHQRARMYEGPATDLYRRHELHFDTFLPYDAWFGEGPKIAALPDPLLGEPLDKFFEFDAIDLRRMKEGTLLPVIGAPATRWSAGSETGIDVDARSPDQPIARAKWLMFYDTPSERDQLVALLERKWGRPTRFAIGWTFTTGHGMSVVVTDASSALTFSLERSAAEGDVRGSR